MIVERDLHISESDDRSEATKSRVKAVGVMALGSTTGWLSTKGIELCTDADIGTMGEIAMTLGGGMVAALTGLVISIESIIHTQKSNRL